MHRPQTIQIYLPAGDPRGMRAAEITTRIIRVVEVPHSLLGEFLKMPEALQVGVYFLIGELSESGLPRAYIGQSGNVGKRLAQHNQDTDRGKDFWNRALVVVSLTNSMTQTHALFLEWLAIGKATQAGRYSLENGNAAARPHTPAPLEADCHEIHETAATLLATLGQPIFEPLTHPLSVQGIQELFYCTASGANGIGEYTAEGFVILKDSKARLEIVESKKGSRLEETRVKLLAEKAIVSNGDVLVFTRDYLMTSPSAASSLLMGRSSNGWVDWKDGAGKTMDEVKRQTPLV
jgi:predicted GIY-YIG superfamily endonuclease